jgi:hypothetical protein
LTSVLRQILRLGLVLTFLLVLMTTQVGTGLFCLVRFIKRFLREVFFRAAIFETKIDFFGFLSVGLIALHILTSRAIAIIAKFFCV